MGRISRDEVRGQRQGLAHAELGNYFIFILRDMRNHLSGGR